MNNRQKIVAVAVVIGVLGGAFLYRQIAVDSYEDCVLKRLPGTGDQLATRAILNACRTQFPDARPRVAIPQQPTLPGDARGFQLPDPASLQPRATAQGQPTAGHLVVNHLLGGRGAMNKDQFAALVALINLVVSYAFAWLVFYAFTRQANPFKKPEELQKRPKWFLSLWLSVLLGSVLDSPTTASKDDFLGNVVIKTVYFVFFMLPGMLGYLVYKIKIKKAMKSTGSGL